MANALSNIVKAITSPDSLRVRTQQLRGSVLETVVDCRSLNANGAEVAPNIAQNEGILLCPIKLYDRISSMRILHTAQGSVTTYSLGLYGLDMASGPALITQIGAANLIGRLGADANSPIIFEAEKFSYATLWQMMTDAQRKVLRDSKFKDDSSFVLAFVNNTATAETAVRGMYTVIRTVEGAPSTQDASITV